MAAQSGGSGRKKKGRGHRQGTGTLLAGRAEVSGAAPRSRQKYPAPSVEGWILMVTGVHEDAADDDVREAFEDFGQLVDVQLPIDRRTGYVKGYALVQFAKKDEARAALSEMDGADLLGETLSVTWAVVKQNADGGGRGRQNNRSGGGGGGGRRRRSKSRGSRRGGGGGGGGDR